MAKAASSDPKMAAKVRGVLRSYQSTVVSDGWQGASRGRTDLMAALKKSIGEAPSKAKVKTGAPASRRQASGGRKR